ncbi:MAG TPA: phage tail protein [Pyrinomonadaceae bacterium]|jgi:phage tail-like protein
MSTKNRFVVEIDGISKIEATKVDGLDIIKHTPSKLMVGNRPNAILGRGNYEVGEVTVNHAEALGQTSREVWRWYQDYVKGVDVGKRNVRVVHLDEDGVTLLAEYLLTGCVPTSFKNDGMDAGSSDPSFFTFGIQPEDSQRF